MLKVTKDGIKRIGPVRKLSLEDWIFIREMFEELSNYEKPYLIKEGEILSEEK